MEGVDLLLILARPCVHRHCEESLAALREKHERIGVPVLTLPSLAVGDGVLTLRRVSMVQWSIHIQGLTNEIEGALNVNTHHPKGRNSTAGPSSLHCSPECVERSLRCWGTNLGGCLARPASSQVSHSLWCVWLVPPKT